MFAPRVAKPKAMQPQRSTVVAQRPSQSAVSQMHLLQQSIGNQAVLRLLAQRATATRNVPGTPENQNDAAPTAAQAAAPSWDFSKIPVISPGRAERFQTPPHLPAPRLPGPIQGKLKVGAVDDPLEHEADRVADQVMLTPAPGVALTSAPPQVSRKCVACEAEEERKLQRKEGGTTEGAASEAPASVHEVLRSPGQPLDPASRAYFEPRFRHDFSRVRVHTDDVAEQSAQGLNAHAYVVGHDIVFGAGQYAPGTHAGGRLLAHELTHVVQQGGVIQCKPAPDVGAVRKEEARLAELARDPREAHRAWKKLSTEDKFIVLYRMGQLYGAAFADQFREVAQHGRPEFSITYWQPHSGPTPERLKASGWRFLDMEVTGSGAIDVELWVNPSGGTIRRDVSTYQYGQTEKKKEEPPKPQQPTDEVAELRKKLGNIEQRLGPAMADFKRNVEGLESDPDSALIEARISISLKTVRGLITELVNLYNQTQNREAGAAWSSAMQKYLSIYNKYTDIKGL
jgi:hypothetical protein